MADTLFTFHNTTISTWKRLLINYDKVLKLFCEEKSKKGLADLDEWFQISFGNQIKDRKPPHLSKSDLTKLMEWKLTRGKFRPRLTRMIAENPDDIIKKVSVESFINIGNAKTAILNLCKLKAVGPATASAILTAYAPEKYAFMADEAVAMVLSGKIDYTLKYYLTYLKEVQEKAEQLSKNDSHDWTPHQVELALWTFKISKQLNVDLEDDSPIVQKKNGKRKPADTCKKEKGNKKQKI